jgi:hypothetical protein
MEDLERERDMNFHVILRYTQSVLVSFFDFWPPPPPPPLLAIHLAWQYTSCHVLYGFVLPFMSFFPISL